MKIGIVKLFTVFALALGIAGAQGAAAGPLTGHTVSASGGNTWSSLSATPQGITASYSLGAYGIPVLLMSLDTDGLISITAHPTSCSSGCGWNFGADTFDFTLDAAAPDILGLTSVATNPSLGATFSMISADTFRLSIATPASGTTNVTVTSAQLDLQAVPLPATLPLLGFGIVGAAAVLRKKKA